MLIVMLIITVLIAIALPNVTKQTASVDDKGCKAFVHIIGNINNLSRNSVIPGISEVGENLLIVLDTSRRLQRGVLTTYLAKQNKRSRSVLIELPTLLEPSNNRTEHDVKHFSQSLDVPILSLMYGHIKGEEESFNRIQAVEALFFVVREGMPINLINLIVRLRRADAENAPISSFKLFLVSVDDEQARTALKGSVGSLASHG
jgi:competence protein ComGC